ncbi:hypothetical protein DAPPUDRAFT_258995 [Daphnia pulex]|uniref:Uncharacterized protein n=1 Tax=Daphnia pulex TaxID=6669 RepID=E9HGE6_DAPPU|nr:hypothetical protein DAPPUDRAFT_258995 [Daphnia pulex]|eukprot:EFX69215.1 hypothetical protein DAPPUDRAFT_258995 [Daphnia pulex]
MKVARCHMTKRSLPQTCEEIFEKALSDVLRGENYLEISRLEAILGNSQS